MADPFQPRFVDLVRNFTATQGTGNFVLGPAVNGFTGFGSALQVGDSFYYSAIGVDKPAEREVGRGTLQANGQISRSALSGTLTNFSNGTKSIALIAAAEWFNTVQGGAGGSLPVMAANRAAIASATSQQVPALLSETGREGLFTFDGSNLSAKVAADPGQGVYVAPASASTGASGAWVRKFSGSHNVKWFGAVGDDVTNDSAAFQAALNYLTAIAFTNYGYNVGSPSLFIPAGKYFLGSATLDILTTLVIQGEGGSGPGGGISVLRWAANTTGIRLQRYNTTGASGTDGGATHKGGDSSLIRGLLLKGAYAGVEGEYHGIHARASVAVEDVQIYDFQGDGVRIEATIGGSPEGAANAFHLQRVVVQGNRHGLYVNGADTNAGTIVGLSTIANRGWGVWDTSFLGSAYFGCHAATNGSGPYKTDELAAQHVFTNCYSEMDQAPSSFSQGALILNGLHAAGVTGGVFVEAALNKLRVGTLWAQGNIEGYGASHQLGPTSGAAADSVLYLNNTNAISEIIGVSSGVQKGRLRFYSGSGPILEGNSAVRFDIVGTGAVGTIQSDGLHITGVGAFSGALSASNFSGSSSGTNTGDQTITLTGDVTGSGSGNFAATIAANAVATAKIANGAVTYAKIQNVSTTSKLLGRASAGAGVVEELGLAAGLTISGTNLSLGAITPTGVVSTGAVTSSSATAGHGYATGAGGTVTQATSKSTGVTLNKVCGQITMNAAALAVSTSVGFTLTNSAIAATDVVVVNVASAATADSYQATVDAVAAGSCRLSLRNISAASKSEAVVLNFAVCKAVIA